MGRGPLLAAESERERQCENQAPPKLMRNVLCTIIASHLDLTEGDHHDKGHDEISGYLAEDVGVGNLPILAVGIDGFATNGRSRSRVRG